MRSTHAPKACITGVACITHKVRISFRKERITQKSKEHSRKAVFFAFLVEMAGIEPASKNLFLQPSTCLFCLLRFPYTNAGKQALMLGILSPWRGRGTPPLTFTTNRRPYLSRGTLKQDGSLIKLRKQLYFCQLFLKIRFSKRSRNAACLSQFKIPVETFTSPYILFLSFTITRKGRRGRRPLQMHIIPY